jgi:hypothetical protein
MAGRVSRGALAVAVALAAGSAGCETLIPMSCDRSIQANPPVVYTGGAVTDGTYASAPWNGELLDFPGGMRYDLVVHGLAVSPQQVELFLSFDQYGTFDGGTLAQAAGNQAVIAGVTTCLAACDHVNDKQACDPSLCPPEDTVIQVVNDSCVEYYLLVTAS